MTPIVSISLVCMLRSVAWLAGAWIERGIEREREREVHTRGEQQRGREHAKKLPQHVDILFRHVSGVVVL